LDISIELSPDEKHDAGREFQTVTELPEDYFHLQKLKFLNCTY